MWGFGIDLVPCVALQANAPRGSSVDLRAQTTAYASVSAREIRKAERAEAAAGGDGSVLNGFTDA